MLPKRDNHEIQSHRSLEVIHRVVDERGEAHSRAKPFTFPCLPIPTIASKGAVDFDMDVLQDQIFKSVRESLGEGVDV